MNRTRTLCASVAAVIACIPSGLAQEPQKDIVDTVLTVHKFNTFVSLLRDADLTFELQQQGPFTVLIPTNEAFERSFSPERLERIRWNKASLRRLLMYHVVRGKLDAESIAKAGSIQPLSGGPIKTEIINGRGHVGGARFEIPNVHARNGIMHGIDQVLTPTAAPAPQPEML